MSPERTNNVTSLPVRPDRSQRADQQAPASDFFATLLDAHADRAADRAPGDASAWERVGRLRLRLMERDAARVALERARTLGPSVEGLLDLALVHHLEGDVGAEVSACEQATLVDRDSAAAWSRLAHALARTDRTAECVSACERALALHDDPEVVELLARVRGSMPRELHAA